MKIENPFWLHRPLKPQEEELVDHLLYAHAQAARRENISSTVVQVAFAGCGDAAAAVASALGTLGGVHAPIAATQWLLMDEAPVMAATELLMQDRRVPGWGNSFVKGPDTLFLHVDDCLREHWPAIGDMIDTLTRTINAHQEAHGRSPIFPNPSCYTAAVAIALELPPALASWLFVAGRLETWGELMANQLGEGMVP